MPEQALVVTEVRDELGYLFDAPSYVDIRGAGALLESLARFTLPTLTRRREFDGAGIVTGGRHYVATFPSAEIGQRFSDEARRIYRQRTAALALHATTAEVSADELLTAFGTQLRRVRQALRQQRAAAPIQPCSSPELRWCDACHHYPATQQRGDELICRPCLNRRTHLSDQDARLGVPGYQSGLADAGEEDLAARPVWERQLRWFRDNSAPKGGDAASDIAALLHRRLPGDVQLADAAGCRAVIVAEVNDYSWLLEQSADSQRALRISTRLNRLLDDAFFEALGSTVWRERSGPTNFEVLLAGGDRLVCLLPADVAPAVAARALRTFESQSAFATEGRRLNFCAGIGLASAAVNWSTTAFQARQALAAARQTYLRTAASAPRGSWRSLVGVEPVGGEQGWCVNVGELERALAHARTLRRVGLEAVQLLPMADALRIGSAGRLAWRTSTWTEPQRRALAAVMRDLALGAAETDRSGGVLLWPAIATLLDWASPIAPPASPRPRQGSEGTLPAVERSA